MRNSILAVLALSAASAPVLAQERRSLTYDDYFRIHSVGEVALSPDGTRVVFERSQVSEEENRTHTELWIVPADGSAAAVRLTTPDAEATDPRWIRGGAALAFASNRSVAGAEAATRLWVLPMDAPGEASVLEGVGASAVFDPTGRRVAFTRAVPPLEPHPDPGKPATPEEEKIESRFDGRVYDWMGYRFDRRGYLPDPRDPWATPARQIFVAAVDGSGARRITDLPVDAGALAWRTDGEALAFVADLSARDEHSYERADLWTVDLAGGVTRLTDDEFDYSSPAWSPDGSQVVARGNASLDVVIRERWDHGAPSDLYVFTADGRDRRNLTAEWDLIPGAPTWSADGRWIYFTGGVGGSTHLFRVSPAGGEVEGVTTGDRRVGSVSFSADHAVVAYGAQTPTEPGDVFASPVADAPGSERRLTDLNGALRAEVRLETPARHVFTSADGTPVEGWVLPPAVDRSRSGASPMVLTIHGGPHGSYGSEFAFDRHLLSAAGYFVLFTNPRASTGYGEAFRWGTWGSWGDEDYDDVMAGVDYALEHYPVDPGRLGVTGYSYGGYLTNWIITQTGRFGAAVAGASISNWVSDYGTADIPRTKESEFFGTPWEEEGLANLLAASPVVHAAGVTTPTLFVHGESDHRVPIAEAEQMYTALVKQNVPARFIRYPDSYHGGWTPWRYLHRLMSTRNWFDEWIGEKPVS
ncbi:MAG: S9 family peptidase [Gemmatimonadota bacterium]|nr:S9 family peptidase [Gemmatimonadota bacterium]